MSDTGPDVSAPGRPSTGQALAQNLSEAAGRRERSRNVGALRRLAPYARAHWGNASMAGLFLVLSTCATLGLSGAIRLVVDNLTDKGLDPATVDQKFLILGGVAVCLAATTAMRFFFVTKVGERIVADLRKATYAHILTLDPSYFLKTRTGELLDARPGIAPPVHPTALPVPPRGEVIFENVTFAYPGRPDLPALNDFNLTVRPGERVALVGPSGGGKSTVFRLLLRFYDPQAGRVLMDGVDLREAEPAEVRARLALVAQESPLFSGSALDNIRYGREAATEEEVRAVVRAAQAEAFLAALPEGLNTSIGEKARTLSGGQRQRLAIARALVREAPILLLDEATSALDAENEQLVQRALDAAMKDHTTLVIAHRLATVLKADRIVVMDGGRVVESGTHNDLVARSGLYARLAALQFEAA